MADQTVQYKNLSDVVTVTSVSNSDTLLAERNGSYRRIPVRLLNADGEKTSVDATLTQSGSAADAKAVGDRLGEVGNALSTALSSASSANEKGDASLQLASRAMTQANAAVKTVNGKTPDTNGNVEISVQVSGDGVQIDTTLTKTGYAADAKSVGDALADQQDATTQALISLWEYVHELETRIPNDDGGTDDGGDEGGSKPPETLRFVTGTYNMSLQDPDKTYIEVQAPDGFEAFKNGVEYMVSMGGTGYRVTARDFGTEYGVFLGNVKLANSSDINNLGSDTGEPFLVIPYPSATGPYYMYSFASTPASDTKVNVYEVVPST